MITDQLLGKRLEDAVLIAEHAGSPICKVIHYQAPKPGGGTDKRVVRARRLANGYELVVCSFQTKIE